MLDDLRELIVFCEVARLGGFSRAARKLEVTPTAISRSIAKLERELGARLFNRTSSEFNLTADGAELLRAAEGHLQALGAAIDGFSAARDRVSGRLRVSLTNSYGKFCVLPKLPEFLGRFPDVQLELGFDDSPVDLINSGFDLGLCYGAPSDATYVSRVICRPQLVLVGSPEYLASRGVPREPKDLAAHVCVNVRLPQGDLAFWRFRPLAGGSVAEDEIFHPDEGLVVRGQLDGVVQAAVAGLGLTVAHSYEVAPYLGTGRLKTLLTGYRVSGHTDSEDVHVFFPHRKHMAARARSFIDFLLETGRDTDIDPAGYAA